MHGPGAAQGLMLTNCGQGECRREGALLPACICVPRERDLVSTYFQTFAQHRTGLSLLRKKAGFPERDGETPGSGLGAGARRGGCHGAEEQAAMWGDLGVHRSVGMGEMLVRGEVVGGGECCCYRQKSCICSKFL